MAVSYINEQTSSIADMLTKLFAFMTGTPGWTQDLLDTANGKYAIHKGNVYISFRHATASAANMGIYQALGYTGGNDPGNHPNDSGNGIVTGVDATLYTGRNVALTTAPRQYWAFADSNYVHVVVERSTAGQYMHFGFGEIIKIGDWTGGEYCYGMWRDNVQNTDVAVLADSTHLLDGLNNGAGRQGFAGTMHCEGLPNQGGTGKWAVVMSSNQSSAQLGNDRAAVARIHMVGGFRGGPVASQFGRFSANINKGLIPMYPIMVTHFDRTSGDVYISGFQKDVMGVNIEFYAPGDEVSVGSETWKLFPSYQKYSGAGALTNTTAYQGIAYKKS